MSDLLAANIATVQSKAQNTTPSTIVAAATVAPVNFLTLITGTTAIATITPPVTGAHLLAIVASSTNFSGFLTSGNILVASITNSTVWDNKVSFFVFNPLTAKYHPQYAVGGTNF